jgi:hypothetical protein
MKMEGKSRTTEIIREAHDRAFRLPEKERPKNLGELARYGASVQERALIWMCRQPYVENLHNADVSCEGCPVLDYIKSQWNEHRPDATDFYEGAEKPYFPCLNGSKTEKMLLCEGFDNVECWTPEFVRGAYRYVAENRPELFGEDNR